MYGNLDQLKKRISEDTLIQLTDDQDMGVINEAVITEIAAGVDELIDGYLRGNYGLPLSPVPGLIQAIALDLYVYEIFGRRPTFGIPEAVDKKRAAQVKVLEKIQSGAVQLGSAGAVSAPAQTSKNSIQAVAPKAVFDPDTLDRY